MSVDSVGNSRDRAYASRRQALEEERADELDSIEKKYRKQVKDARQTRSDELNNIRSDVGEELESAQKNATKKISDIQESQHERVKAYQEEAANLTNDAHKKLQQKASELSRYSKELDTQREEIANRHGHTLRELQDSQEKQYQKKLNDYRETQQNLDHERRVHQVEQNERTSSELGNIREENLRMRQHEREQGKNEVSKVKKEEEMALASIEAEKDSHLKSAAQERFRIQQNLEHNKERLRDQYQESIDRMYSDSKTAVNQEMRRNDRSLREVKDRYGHEMYDLDKSHKRSVQEKQYQTEQQLQALQSKNDQEMHRMNQAYLLKKNQFDKNSGLAMQSFQKESEELKDNLNKEYILNEKQINDKHAQMYATRNNTIKEEITNQQTIGDRELNKVMLANSKKIDEYSRKSTDPFYALRSVGGHVNDGEREVMIRIDVPDYEQDRIRINGKLNEITISGSRSYQDKAKSENGTVVSTNSNQSYSESYPIKGLPLFDKMSRSYEDGVLMVRIPKA